MDMRGISTSSSSVTPRLPSSRPCKRQALADKHISNRSAIDRHNRQGAPVAILAMPVDAIRRLQDREQPVARLHCQVALIGALAVEFGCIDVGNAYLLAFMPEGVPVDDAMLARARGAE